jgi:hypothetical protein
MARAYSFKLKVPQQQNDSERIIGSLWLKPITAINSFNATSFGANIVSLISVDTMLIPISTLPSFSLVAKTGIIEGWQQYEAIITTKANIRLALQLPNGYYYDDLRITPFAANSKAFVYDPITWQLSAQLDENNFATYYEYDSEGNLIRTKKETEQGIVTIAETRNTHKKN